MGFSTAGGTIIRMGVEGAESTSQRIDGVASSMHRAGGASKGLSLEFARFLGPAAALTAALAVMKEALGAQREFDKLNSSLITATGSSENAAVAFKALQAFAASTPYSVAEVTKAFIKMRNMGLDPSEHALRSYGNTAAAMGKSLDQMVEAVADAATGEFERLKEFGIKASKQGEQVQFTFQGVKTTVANNAGAIEKYLQKLGDVNFAGGMETRAATLDGAISNLGDTWSDTMRKLAQAGPGDKAREFTLGLSDALADLGAMFAEAGRASGEEADSIKLSTIVHTGLTTVFKAVVLAGVHSGFVLSQVGKALGSLASQARAVMKGDFSEAFRIGQEMRDGLAKDFDAVVARTKAVYDAGETARKVAEQEAREKAAAHRDDLARFKIKEAAAGQSAEAIKKEAEAYQSLITSIRTATAEGRLELAAGEQATASQKARIKMDQELASGKLQLSKAHQAALRAALEEQSAVEQALKVRQAEKETFDWIVQSTQARLASKDALAQEYALYGQVSEARDIATVALRAEAELEKQLADMRKAGKPITEAMEAQLRREKDLRVGVEQATLAQTKALGYAQQLAAENKRFAAESISDEKARSAALLAIDAETWQKRIDLAGEGTEAQRLLQQEYETWYANQLQKPQLEEQRKFWASIESTAHDTFVSIANGGKDAATRLKETMKNVFFDWLYSMTLKKWIINIQGSMSTSGAGGAVAQMFGQGGGAGGGPISLLQTAKGAYDALTNGLSAFSTSVGGMLTTVGNFFGSSSLSAFGTGMGMSSSQAAAAAQAYNAAGMTGTGSAISAGSTVGAVGTAAAGVIGGVYGGRLVSGGYSAFGGSGNSAVNAGTAIGATVGSIVPVIGTAVGALVGGLIGGTVNRMFGHKAKEIQEAGIRGNLGADSTFSGEGYANWTKKGGWFRSDKHGTDLSPVDATTSATLTSTYKQLKEVTVGFGQALGVSGAAIEQLGHRSQAVNIKLTKDAAENQKAVETFFAGVADAMAQELVPGLGTFTQQGESSSAALQRIATNYRAVDAILVTLSETSQQAFGAVGVASVAARERLIGAAGGLDKLASGVAYFAENFLTEQERNAPVIKSVREEMAKLGFAGVTTIEQFKKLVLGFDRSTEAGAKTYVQLLELAPAFKQAAEAASKLADSAENLAERTKAAAEAARVAAEARLSSAQDIAGAALAGVGRAVDAEKAKAQASYEAAAAQINAVANARKAAAETEMQAAKETYSVLQSLQGRFRDSLRSLRKMSQEEGVLALQRARDFANRGGSLAKYQDLDEALSAASNLETRSFSSMLDFQRAQDRTASLVDDLKGRAGEQLNTAERTVDALERNINAIEESRNLQLAAAAAHRDAEMLRLDGVLAGAQAQLNAINKVDTSVLTIPQALQALTSAISGLQAAKAAMPAGGSLVGSSPGLNTPGAAAINSLYQSLLGRNGEAAGMEYWLNRYNNGASLEAIAQGFTNSAEYRKIKGFASGGSHLGGARLVGEDGPEIEVTGPSRIFNARQTQSLLQKDNSDVVAVVGRLIKRIDDQGEYIEKLEKHARRTADILAQVTQGGDTVRTTEKG